MSMVSEWQERRQRKLEEDAGVALRAQQDGDVLRMRAAAETLRRDAAGATMAFAIPDAETARLEALAQRFGAHVMASRAERIEAALAHAQTKTPEDPNRILGEANRMETDRLIRERRECDQRQRDDRAEQQRVYDFGAFLENQRLTNARLAEEKRIGDEIARRQVMGEPNKPNLLDRVMSGVERAAWEITKEAAGLTFGVTAAAVAGSLDAFRQRQQQKMGMTAEKNDTPKQPMPGF